MGWLLAAMPPLFAWALSRVFGHLLYILPTRRRRLLLQNLHHAFPEKTEDWRRNLARESCYRGFETGLFVLASPFFSKARLRRRFSLHEEALELLRKTNEEKRRVVVLTPHFSMMEAVTLFPALTDDPVPETGVIYRPLDNAKLEDWVKRTRERFGLRLLSRKKGFLQAVDILHRGGAVAVLFDQNAGDRGDLTLFFDRVSSTTELPGALAEQFNADVAVLYPERRGFWRATIRASRLTCEPVCSAVTIEANRWLEDKLRSDACACADWLWLHDRWRHQDSPSRRLRLQSRRNLLPETLTRLKLTALPRRTRFWVRMPNWLGDVVMALPLIRAIRASRPDAELTLLAQPHFLPLLQRFGIADKLVPLPKRGFGYYQAIRRLRLEYPDTFILLTNSFRGDLEAKLTGTRQRFGLVRPGHPRPLLSHKWEVPADLDLRQTHQTRLWELFLRHFGLEGDLDLRPFEPGITPNRSTPVIGLICGTENSPEKRWPIGHWREFISLLRQTRPDLRFRLFGTARDAETTAAVAKDFPTDVVEDLAGRTSIPAFADLLCECSLVACNDTGGMHLANALGVPILAIFGPTNPVRTGPIFNGPATILQPPHCPPTGGVGIDLVSPQRVANAALDVLHAPSRA